MSVDIQNIITCATSLDDRLSGLGVARGRISRFPIDLRRRPYNTLALPCECVILRLFVGNHHRRPLSYGTCSQGISQFYLHTHTFIRNRNEPYLPLPSQPQLVLIYRPRRDGRLSRPWCEVAQAEIRNRNLPIANPALYHTATSAPSVHFECVPFGSHKPPDIKNPECSGPLW